jgi:large subunit ribosomal protein L23
MSRSPSEVIHGPLVTERSYALFQVNPRISAVPRYTFKVALDATKPEIARALEEVYEAQGIKVVAVNTLRVHGKVRRTTRRGVTGRTPNWKKAIVTLQEGQRLEGLFGSL